MKQAQRKAAEQELTVIRNRAEALADALDPRRTWTAKDETTRAVVKAADVITRQANQALSMLRIGS